MGISPFPRLYADTSKTPRYHGNGFVQLPLNGHTRLHVWSPHIPALPGHNSNMHDHVWDLDSTVLLGTLRHTHFELSNEINEGVAVDVYSVGEPGVQGLGPMLGSGAIRVTGDYQMAVGSRYRFYAYEFHSSIAEGWTATLMTKRPTERPDARPRILCPRGEQPTDAFALDYQPRENVMWSVIQTALEQMSTEARAKVSDMIK